MHVARCRKPSIECLSHSLYICCHAIPEAKPRRAFAGVDLGKPALNRTEPDLDHATETTSKPFAVTNRSVLAIAVPMTLAYLTTPLLGLTETAVVGQLGDAALLGGLAAGALVFDVVFTTFNFLRSGTTGLVSQAFGRGDAL